MFRRICFFFLCQLAGGALGWALASAPGSVVGVVIGSALWLAVDLARAIRMLGWLRQEAQVPPATTHGLWGEAMERVRRLLRARDQQLRAAQDRLQDFLAAIQASPNGVVLLDADDRIEWSNLTAAEHFGIDPERDLLQLIGNLVRDPRFTAYAAGNDFSREVVIETYHTASNRRSKLSVHLHPYGEGRRLLLSRDITSLEQAEAMRRDFVANVSHEIRTPLTVLTGFIETLQNLQLGDEERARYLGLMGQQSGRMQTLVNDLLTLSRLEGSPPPGTPEWTPLAVLIAQCEQDAQSLCQALDKPQQLRFAPPPALELGGSAGELLSAFSNLVSNAVRYTPANGAVDVQWRVLADGRAEFSVRDTGPGIASEHLPRLTERFYRVDRSRSRETGGTGLGLAIVKHVVQRHGAELKIDSVPGAGSTFSIVFPSTRLRPANVSRDTSAPRATESLAG